MRGDGTLPNRPSPLIDDPVSLAVSGDKFRFGLLRSTWPRPGRLAFVHNLCEEQLRDGLEALHQTAPLGVAERSVHLLYQELELPLVGSGGRPR